MCTPAVLSGLTDGEMEAQTQLRSIWVETQGSPVRHLPPARLMGAVTAAHGGPHVLFLALCTAFPGPLPWLPAWRRTGGRSTLAWAQLLQEAEG